MLRLRSPGCTMGISITRIILGLALTGGIFALTLGEEEPYRDQGREALTALPLALPSSTSGVSYVANGTYPEEGTDVPSYSRATSRVLADSYLRRNGSFVPDPYRSYPERVPSNNVKLR